MKRTIVYDHEWYCDLIDRLSRVETLNAWERSFVRGMAHWSSWFTKKQRLVIRNTCKRHNIVDMKNKSQRALCYHKMQLEKGCETE